MKIKKMVKCRKDILYRDICFTIAIVMVIISLVFSIYTLYSTKKLLCFLFFIMPFIFLFGGNALSDALYHKTSSDEINLFKLKKNFIIYKKNGKFKTAFRTILGWMDSNITPEEEKEFAYIAYEKIFENSKKPKKEKYKLIAKEQI